MSKFNKLIAIMLMSMSLSPVFAAPAATTVAPKQEVKPAINATQTITAPIKVTPLNVVKNPIAYMNKTLVMEGKFDKFTALGLDYKKAMRNSQDYVGFMFQREDVKDHNVPLSEMKLFIKRDYAEKFIDLNTGDKIKVTGKMFSNALGDAWVDIDTITILEKEPLK